MISVFFKSVTILAINIACGVSYTACLDINRQYAPWETKSALYKIPDAQHFGWLLMGSSHAEVFGHCPENIAYLQRRLGDGVSCLTKRGSGVFQHRLFLEEYYAAGNSADHVVYFVDPWAFYSRHWNETMRFIDYEPLDLSFTSNLIRAGVSPSTLLFYARSKFTREWRTQQPDPPDVGACLRKLERRDPAMVNRSVQRFFPVGTESNQLDRYMQDLIGIIDLANANGSQLTLVTTPTLLGDLPGTEEFHAALDDLLKPYEIPYHDFSNAVEDVGLFHDHDHLNDAGVGDFIDAHLVPVLARKQTEPTSR